MDMFLKLDYPQKVETNSNNHTDTRRNRIVLNIQIANTNPKSHM